MKDIHAGKLDARAQVGHFVGYDAESKGFRIYWPRKQSITIERNVVFNENNTHTSKNFAIIPGDALAEGEKDEKDKVIQHPPSNVEDAEEPEEPINQGENNIQTPQKQDKTHQNSIIFPTTPSKPNHNNPIKNDPNLEAKNEPQAYGRGQRSRPAPGTYRMMNDGLVSALVQEYEPEDEPLPPYFALIRPMNFEPKSLDKALRGPDAGKWQESLDYEISQLEKLGTWVVEDLPKGQMAIPVRGHPPNPVSLTESNNPALTSIPTPYVPPHRRVHFKDLIVT